MDRLNRVDLSILDAVVENHTNVVANINQLDSPEIEFNVQTDYDLDDIAYQHLINDNYSQSEALNPYHSVRVYRSKTSHVKLALNFCRFI